jgi:hypothetical protein
MMANRTWLCRRVIVAMEDVIVAMTPDIAAAPRYSFKKSPLRLLTHT